MMATIINFRTATQRMRGVPSLSMLLDDWLADRRADGRRPRGVQGYREVFARFVAYTGDVPVCDVTIELVRQYKRYLSERVCAGTTRHALTVIRAFCSWCVERGHLPENPALAVPHPQVFPPDPDPLSREQVRALLSALDEPPRSHRQTWRRNRRAVCLMLYAGLRIAEVSGLLWRDIDMERRTITVRSEIAKGGRMRVLPICQELYDELDAAEYRQGAVVDQGDGDGRGRPLTVKSVAHVFERWLARRGMRIHAHQLRKTFATELYLRGEDILTIQRLLGHADPKTTLRYVGASAQLERDAVERLKFR